MKYSRGGARARPCDGTTNDRVVWHGGQEGRRRRPPRQWRPPRRRWRPPRWRRPVEAAAARRQPTGGGLGWSGRLPRAGASGGGPLGGGPAGPLLRHGRAGLVPRVPRRGSSPSRPPRPSSASRGGGMPGRGGPRHGRRPHQRQRRRRAGTVVGGERGSCDSVRGRGRGAFLSTETPGAQPPPRHDGAPVPWVVAAAAAPGRSAGGDVDGRSRRPQLQAERRRRRRRALHPPRCAVRIFRRATRGREERRGAAMPSPPPPPLCSPPLPRHARPWQSPAGGQTTSGCSRRRTGAHVYVGAPTTARP